MNRQAGYYWVKLHGEWVIAKWYFENGYHWDLFDGGMPFKDNQLEEIDERRIEREEPIIRPEDVGPKQAAESIWLINRLFNK